MTDKHAQAERFREAARAIGADESDDALDRAMSKLDLKAKPKPIPPEPPKYE